MARGDNWTQREVELVVADYLEMLILELSGQPYNKSQTRRELLATLDAGRTKGSVESKRMNISAALLDIGMPCIDGYKPFSNYQKILSEVLDIHIASDLRIKEILDKQVVAPIEIPTVDDILKVMETPPEKRNKEKGNISDSEARPSPLGINYLEVDANNSILGAAGEEFCLRFEKARLIFAGASNLADRIEHVSETIGPSAGYDIRSYERDGQDRYIEVKTTKYGKRTPFFISPNEVSFSVKEEDKYHLYRLYKFTQKPGLFSLLGSVADSCELIPSQLRASVR
jgi:hypothetical protein